MDVNIGYDHELSINPKEISGKWRAGWALDAHTLSSIHLGNQMFDTKRTELGELVYLLKYNMAVSPMFLF